jgi:hypothetical protein
LTRLAMVWYVVNNDFVGLCHTCDNVLPGCSLCPPVGF